VLNCSTANNECITSERSVRGPKQLAGQNVNIHCLAAFKVEASIGRLKLKRELVLWSGNEAERDTQEMRREGA